jgi:hypothetical protein
VQIAVGAVTSKIHLGSATIVTVGLVLTVTMVSSGATSLQWAIGIAASSKGISRTTTAPATPTAVAAACTSATVKTIKITFTGVTHATSYTLFDATTSATGTYSSLATGITISPYTTVALANGNYWFELEALVGTNWVSVKSSATAEYTIENPAPTTTCTTP